MNATRKIFITRLIGVALASIGLLSLLTIPLFMDFNRFYFPSQKHQIPWIELATYTLLVLYGIAVIITGRFKVSSGKR
jgi:protein-S-isoprenylcysteine O-methyltransferase Ste14